MNRRSFLKSILASGVAPYVVTTAGVLMPVRALSVPELGHIRIDNEIIHVRFASSAHQDGYSLREWSRDGGMSWAPEPPLLDSFMEAPLGGRVRLIAI